MEVKAEKTFFFYPARNWEGESPLPCLLKEGYWNIYPYGERDCISHTTTFRKFDAYIIENEYLQAMVLPQFGCRLARLFDKVSGKDVFCLPQSFRPSPIFLRGLYFPLGLELNFPQGHNVHSGSTLPAEFVDLPGGGRGIQLKLYNAVARIDHNVIWSLRPGERVLRQEITFTNTAPVRNGFMYWANPAVENSPELEMQVRAPFCFFFTGYDTFPMIDGKDMRKSRNRVFASDLFVIDSDVDWFGFYAFDRGIGALHHAPRGEMCGKKMFTWGFDEYARRWGDLYQVPGAHGYVEVQAGILGTQMEHTHLEPFEQKTLREAWQPVSHIIGRVIHSDETIVFSGDNRELQIDSSVVLENVTVKVDGTETFLDRLVPGTGKPVRIPVNFDCDNCELKVFREGKPIFSHRVTPMIPAGRAEIQARQEWLDLKPDSEENLLEVAWRHYKAHRFQSARELVRNLDSAPAKLLLSELEWWEKQERLVPGLPDRNLTKSAMARAEYFYLKGDRAAAAAELSGKNYLERAVSAFLDGKKFSEESDDETPMPFTVLERDALTAAAGESAKLALGNYYSVRDRARAAAFWRQAPSRYVAWRNLGYEAMRNGDWQAAEQSYRQAVKLNPSEPHLLVEYAHVMRVNGNIPEALALIGENPDYRLRKVRMELLRESGDFLGALKIFREGEFMIWEGESNFHRVYKDCLRELGIQALKNGNAGEAGRFFERILQYPAWLNKSRAEFENQSMGYYFLGLAAKDDDRRREYFEAAVRQPTPRVHHWPSFIEEEYFMALAAKELGRMEVYETVCRRLREVSENIPENYEFLHYVNYHAALAGVRAQILRNDRDKAQTALEKLALYVGKNAVYHEEARRIEKEIA